VQQYGHRLDTELLQTRPDVVYYHVSQPLDGTGADDADGETVRAEHWTETLASVEERRGAILTREGTGRDGLDLLEAELERACLTWVLGKSRVLDQALATACAAATAAGIAWLRDRGRLEMPVPGGVRLFPARGVSIGPSVWLAALGVCRALRDEAALAVLGHPPLLDLLGEIGDDFWTPVGRALTRPTDETIAAARAALAELGETLVEPAYVALRVRPLLDLVAAAEQTAFDAALAAALRSHEEFYTREEWEYDVLGLLAFPVLGLAALGHDRGLELRVTSDRLPAQVVRGGAGSLGTVRYHFPPARLHRSEEATWFLDLEGFPRSGRSHGMQAAEGKLWACYTARNGPGLPEARLSVEPPPPAGGLEDLMDVGELVLAADLLAGRSGDDRQRRAWLGEAAECLAEARARPEPRFVHERGWAAYRAEPARFDPARLAAVEDAWREIVASDSPLRPASSRCCACGWSRCCRRSRSTAPAWRCASCARATTTTPRRSRPRRSSWRGGATRSCGPARSTSAAPTATPTWRSTWRRPACSATTTS
jgi:hypothetical protein